MDRDGGGAEVLELVDEPVRHVLGPDEDVHPTALRGLQDPGQHPGLVHPVDLEEVLGDQGSGVLLLVVGPGEGRVLHVPAGEPHDRGGHRGREQHRVAILAATRLDQALDVGEEAHVEHLVGLVQHQLGDVREVEVASVEVVEQTPGGADDHVDAALERLDLLLVGDAPVDADRGEPQRLADGEVLVHLVGELARRGDHQRLRRLLRRVDPLQQRQAERQRLARPGPGLADQVVAVERQGQRQLLDREGVGDALVGQRIAERFVHAEVMEGLGHVVLSSRRSPAWQVHLAGDRDSSSSCPDGGTGPEAQVEESG